MKVQDAHLHDTQICYASVSQLRRSTQTMHLTGTKPCMYACIGDDHSTSDHAGPAIYLNFY